MYVVNRTVMLMCLQAETLAPHPTAFWLYLPGKERIYCTSKHRDLLLAVLYNFSTQWQMATQKPFSRRDHSVMHSAPIVLSVSPAELDDQQKRSSIQLERPHISITPSEPSSESQTQQSARPTSLPSRMSPRSVASSIASEDGYLSPRLHRANHLPKSETPRPRSRHSDVQSSLLQQQIDELKKAAALVAMQADRLQQQLTEQAADDSGSEIPDAPSQRESPIAIAGVSVEKTVVPSSPPLKELIANDKLESQTKTDTNMADATIVEAVSTSAFTIVKSGDTTAPSPSRPSFKLDLSRVTSSSVDTAPVNAPAATPATRTSPPRSQLAFVPVESHRSFVPIDPEPITHQVATKSTGTSPPSSFLISPRSSLSVLKPEPTVATSPSPNSTSFSSPRDRGHGIPKSPHTPRTKSVSPDRASRRVFPAARIVVVSLNADDRGEFEKLVAAASLNSGVRLIAPGSDKERRYDMTLTPAVRVAESIYLIYYRC